ncbi:MAG TPA: hypothetical protein PLD88_08300, partial [Candidatus Berkiella sp.]|nr:hypothetical protein [Candidatus Berkiella sp.]
QAIDSEMLKSAISTLMLSSSSENELYKVADRAIDELLTADRDYFENGAVPDTGFCKTAVEHISQGLDALKPKLATVIEAQGLENTSDTTAAPVKSTGWGDFFTNAIFGRRKAFVEDTQDSETDEELSDSEEVSDQEDIDSDGAIEQTEVAQTVNPFSFASVKNMLGGLLGSGYAKDKTPMQSDPDPELDGNNADPEVDINLVNELLADMSPLSSDYFTPNASGMSTPIEMSEVFTANFIPGIDETSNNTAVVSPVAQQLLTETHDSGNGSIFG